MSPRVQPASLTATATYTSLQNEPFQISQTLDLSSSSPSQSSDLTAETQQQNQKQQRISHLSQLHQATAKIQASINKELTQRMEEDKAREAAIADSSAAGSGNQNGKGKKCTTGVIDDEAEEQNYGEEVVEDSD